MPKAVKYIATYDDECNFILADDTYELIELINSEVIDMGHNLDEVKAYKAVPMSMSYTVKDGKVITDVEIEEE